MDVKGTREILFRGKRLSNGEWAYGFIIKTFGIYYIIDKDDNKNIAYKIIPETVGQYTGLTDKNGKKIFEGDIVKTDKFSEPNKQYIIKYDLQFGAFIGQDRYDLSFVTFDGDSGEFEVIGNVTDNPDLLEK